MEAAVIKADLVDTLSGEGPFTVFAPTDDAFVALLEVLGDDYTSLDDFDEEAEIALLTDILLYHVVPGSVLAADLQPGSVPTALEDNNLHVVASGETFVIGDASEVDANITGTDILASNGVAHTVDIVLLPQSALDFVASLNQKNLVEIVVENENLSVLEAAVIKAGLADTLSGDGPFTVFAPTDDAFVALLDILGDDYTSLDDFDEEAEIALLTDILLYHVVPAKVLAADLQPGSVPTAFENNNLHVIASGGSFAIGDASDVNAHITGTDILASNGVAHTIDKVLLPQSALDFVASLNRKNLVEIVVENENLSVLEAAVIKAGLADTLSGDGPFTVFAPTDDAFVALLEVLGDDYHSLDDFDEAAEIALLTDILLYHVVPAKVLAADLQPGSVPTAFENNNLHVIASGGSFVIGDASDVNAHITGTDILASNGVAHTINKVLLPQSALDFVASLQLKNIVEIAVETDNLSLLVEALGKPDAGLVELLQGDGPFTVFAPDNHAFVDLLDLLGDDYHSLADFDTDAEKNLLVKVLTYHVVGGAAVFSGDLMDGQHIQTEQGENVTIRKNGDVYIKDATDTKAKVTLADVEASNGVVHIINKVLLPQEVLDILFPPTPNIVELAQSVDDLSLLVDALIQADAGLVEVLSGDGPFTVFAPTNAAFQSLLNALGSDYHSLADFDTPAEKELLAKVLAYHVVSGASVESSSIKNHQAFHTEQGEALIAIVHGHDIDIRDKTHVDANVILADQEASNGIVHVIDKVLLPQEVLDALH
ncbi:MAG: fasciclin domain-containing protein [Bacteroidota bacterium]